MRWNFIAFLVNEPVAQMVSCFTSIQRKWVQAPEPAKVFSIYIFFLSLDFSSHLAVFLPFCFMTISVATSPWRQYSKPHRGFLCLPLYDNVHSHLKVFHPSCFTKISVTTLQFSSPSTTIMLSPWRSEVQSGLKHIDASCNTARSMHHLHW